MEIRVETQMRRGWAEQVKAQIGRRYAAMADDFPPGAAGRAREAGYPTDLPAWIAGRFSGCGYALDKLDLAGVRVAVDLGCGGGLDALLLSRALPRDATVIALDLAPAMLARVSEAAGNCTILPLAGDMERLPLGDAIADLVVANASFNLTLDKPAAFAEAARILRPGGRLVIRDLVRDGALPCELAEDPAAWNTSLGGVVGEAELSAAARSAGLAQVQISGHRPFPPVTAIRLEAVKPETPGERSSASA